MKYIDRFGDPLEIDTEVGPSDRIYITAAKQVSLSPEQVIAIRKQLKRWLIDTGHRKSKT